MQAPKMPPEPRHDEHSPEFPFAISAKSPWKKSGNCPAKVRLAILKSPVKKPVGTLALRPDAQPDDLCFRDEGPKWRVEPRMTKPLTLYYGTGSTFGRTNDIANR